MHLNATAKALIVVTLIVIGIFVGDVLFYMNIASISDRTTDTAEEIEVTEQRVDQFDQRKNVLEENSDSMRQLRAYFVEPQGTVPFLNTVEGLASTTGATIKTQSLSDSSVSDRINRLSLTVKISGRWGEVYNTIALLESLPYKTSINNIQMTRGGKVQTGREQPDTEGTSTPQTVTETYTQWSATLELSVLQRIKTIDTQTSDTGS